MSDSSNNTTEPTFDKRYWLFMYEGHEAHGGINDFAGSYDSVVEAEASFTQDDNHAHIFDSQQKQVVAVWGGMWYWDEPTHDYWLHPDTDGWQERIERATF